MKKRLLLLLIACVSISFCYSQSNLNDYKYVIVEKQFHFQNEVNEYNLNGLARFLFRKNGFIAIIEGEELPADLKGNFCLALKSEVIAKGALRTKATIILKDCENNEVFRSEPGVTKEKDFRRAYELAIREAFKSFEGINYAYQPNQTIIDKGRNIEETQSAKKAEKEIEDLKAEIKELKEKKEPEPIVEETQSEVKDVVEESQPIEVAPEPSDTKWYDGFPKYEHDGNLYYKKPGYGGTYFVNVQNDVVYKLQNTTRTNVYILVAGKYQGVAFYDDTMSDYTFQYYNENDELVTKILRLDQ